MSMQLGKLTYLVRDYDEAIAWFTGKLGFRCLEDTDLGDGKRWVVVAAACGGCSLLLARAADAEQAAAVSRQAGGRVMGFLHSDDFESDYADLKRRGVRFVEEPRREAYGSVAVFEDLYGNRWDLIQPMT